MSVISDKRILPFNMKHALNYIQRDQAKLNDIRERSTSNVKFTSYNVDPVNTRRLLNISTLDIRQEQYQENIRDASIRLGTMEVLHNNIMKDMTSFNSRLIGALNPGTEDTGFQSACRETLRRIADILNSTDQYGNYLFGGTEFSQEPVDITAISTNVASLTSNPTDTSYYQGNTTKANFLINDQGRFFEYGLRADEDCYSMLMSSIQICAQSTDEDDRREALRIVNLAKELIVEGKNRIGNDSRAMLDTEEFLSSYRNETEIAKKEIIDADQLKDITESQILNRKQQNAYVVTSKIINSPRLVDYIK